MRSRENPALNFAAERANELGLPLVVYQGLRPDYPWASDRFHTFILESAADMAADFADRDIPYGFYLERRIGASPGEPRPASPLEQLAHRAAVVVTDYFPTFIVPRQTRTAPRADRRPGRGRGFVHHRADVLYQSGAPDRAGLPHRGGRRPAALPPSRGQRGADGSAARSSSRSSPRFPPAATSRRPPLRPRCDIDHAVGPSPSIRGGQRAAATRLAAFLETRLARYAEDRGDPNHPEAVSGLSPYLHFGNISPQEVLLRVRDVAAPDQYEPLPGRAPRLARAGPQLLPPRPDAPDTRGGAGHGPARSSTTTPTTRGRRCIRWRRLERGETGSALWNAAQRAYVRDGHHAQLPADAVGKGDPALECRTPARRSGPWSTSTTSTHSMGATRTATRVPLDPGEVRPAVLPPPRLRHGALHVPHRRRRRNST